MQVLLTALLAASGVAVAQFIPPTDARARNLTVIRSPGDDSVTVSFKEPKGVCKTTLDTQRQYTGWVNIPGAFPTNLFFWFVEAREPTESLALWINGGPGASSMFSFFTENGPCEVVEKGLDEYDTVAREWGWDRSSNMLFIDQPNQVGFSYDTPTDGTTSLLNGAISTPPSSPSCSLPPWNWANGTFGTNDPSNTVNTTEAAAMAVWHAIQGFLTTFPQYQPGVNASVGLSLFAQSYGGVYGPVFAEVFESQNQRRLTGQLNRDTTLELRLTSLGLVNGCVDMMFQTPFLMDFANRNTYGIKILGDMKSRSGIRNFFSSGGCKEQLEQCQDAMVEKRPRNDIDRICNNAATGCKRFEKPYTRTGASFFDIAAQGSAIQLPFFFAEYLNQARVQQAIGSPVNFTVFNHVVFNSFTATGDMAKDGHIDRIASLLQRGVRIGLIYGDRDWICNWFGGEAVSLAIAQQAGGSYAAHFARTGYAPIVINNSYVGGQVRQYGNLSFSRIYQAGHSVAYYQPETAFKVFSRIITGRSVSTGNEVNLTVYNTTGPLQATHTAIAIAPPAPTCFIRLFGLTCSMDKLILAIRHGGVIINGVLYEKTDDWPLAKISTPTETDSETFVS